MIMYSLFFLHVVNINLAYIFNYSIYIYIGFFVVVLVVLIVNHLLFSLLINDICITNYRASKRLKRAFLEVFFRTTLTVSFC